VPFEHVDPSEHMVPFATQVFPAPGSQHPPPRHAPPAQHAAKAAPHVWQTPPEQTELLVEHCVPSAKHVPLVPALGSQQLLPVHCGVPLQHAVLPDVLPHA
jgi:hypothetical protein